MSTKDPFTLNREDEVERYASPIKKTFHLNWRLVAYLLNQKYNIT